MPYQTKLNVGDIINIKSPKQAYIVVRSEHLRDDPGDGCPYTVDEIDVVPISPLGWLTMFSPGVEQPMRFNGDDIKSFYFEGGSMRGKGKAIKDSDVKVLGTSKVSKTVTVTFSVTKAKSFG